MVFIRNRAHSAFAAHGTERFFEAVQPEHHRHDAADRNTKDTRPRA
ncbi:hypothetical protein NG697_20570 [Pseudarthrobacter sp. MDT3-26]|nr:MULTISPECIES: hypothetical protein [unclassified Pseudarthrobacter]MCO4239692.1 hypothetical protein [Pseudarthrobacter sp. MDT3-28]MCO4265271.1 hypothetical protein [Pseudarthrobacter sp. MDT3-26]